MIQFLDFGRIGHSGLASNKVVMVLRVQRKEKSASLLCWLRLERAKLKIQCMKLFLLFYFSIFL